MTEITLSFIFSQAAVFLAMGFDFLSMQLKKREHTFFCLIISSALISLHYFLLNTIAAGVIIFISVLRFIVCYFTTDKKYLYFFVGINTFSLFFTYKVLFDLIIYSGVVVNIIGNFQKNNQRMRKIMMMGTTIIMLYNMIIFSPMGIVVEAVFLSSNIIGYYRHYLRKDVIPLDLPKKKL